MTLGDQRHGMSILRMDCILDIGFGGGGMASRLEGGSTCMLLGRGESRRCRFIGRWINEPEDAVPILPVVCADLPTVWLDAVVRSLAPGCPMSSVRASSLSNA